MSYVSCKQCGQEEYESSVSDIAQCGLCHECQSDNVAPNVLRFVNSDTVGESVLKYAERLVGAKDRNYVRRFDRNADLKLARALLEAHAKLSELKGE